MQLWWSFCRDEKISVFEAPIPKILQFLSKQLEHIGAYGTLNSYRSALSLIVLSDIGCNPQVKRFFKGVASLKPQKPKYDYIWEPTPVLTYLSSFSPNDNLRLEKLTKNW